MPLDTNKKPGISEATAFQVMSLAKSDIDDVQRARATALLNDYRKQQEVAGEAIFPEWERSQREDLERVKTHFTDRERHGLEDDDFREVSQTYANDPEGKARFFNTQFLARTYGKPIDDIRPISSQYRDEYAATVWGEPVASEAEFSERLAKDFETEEQANDWAQKAALQGLNPLLAQNVPDELAKNPAFVRREKDFRAQQEATYKATSERVAPYRQLIDETRENLRQKTGVKETPTGETKESFAELSQALIDVPKKDLGIVLAAIISEETPEGTKGAGQKLAENFGRGTRDLGIDASGFLGRNVIQKMRGAISDGATPKEGQTQREFLTDLGLDSMESKSVLYASLFSKEIDKSNLSPAQVESLEILDRSVYALDISKKLRQIADNEIDPAKGEYLVTQGIYDATRSLPYMLTAAAGPAGFMITSASLAEESYHQLRDANPGMSEAQALQLSGPAGLVKGALEKIPVKILSGKLPGLERFLNKPIATRGGLAGRLVTRGGLAAGIEMVQENAQDITPFVGQGVISALSEDMPETPWADVFGNMAENQTALFFATLPLALIGAGAGTWRDYNGARGFMADYDSLRAVGIGEAAATSIRNDTVKGRLDAAQKTLRGEFKNLKVSTADIEKTRAEVAVKAIKLRAERMDAIAAAEAIDLLPAVRANTDGGYSLQFQDGTASAQMDSYDEADAARWQYASDNEISIHESTRNVIRRVDSQMEEGREVKYVFDLKRKTLADAVEGGEVSEAAAENRADIAEQQNFETEFNEAQTVAKLSGKDRLASTVILGSNVTEFKDGVQRTVVRLYQDASPLTVIEEKVEGDVSLMLKAAGGREWLRSSLREYEAISGDALFLKGKTDDQLSDGDLKEAFSDLATAYFVGRSKKGLSGDQWGAKGFRRTAAKLMQGKIGDAMQGYGHFFRAVWRRAAKINRLKREGALPKRLEEELARSTGLMEQAGYNKSVVNEAQEMVDDFLTPEGFKSQPVDDSSTGDANAPFSVLVDPDATIAKMFSPFQRNPELRRKLAGEMQKRGQAVARDWAGVIAANRTKKQIEFDRKEVEGELVGKGLLALSDTEKAILEGTAEPVETPILTILKGDKMSSKSAAKKAGISTNEYDGMPKGLPVSVWGGNLGPDQIAQMAGIDDINVFWQRLSGELQTLETRKTEEKAIKEKVKAIEAEAKAESNDFADYLQRQRETVGTDRKTLIGALRTLDAIISALPPEVRGKIGGFVALAELTTPDAMIKEIEKRTVQIDRELEIYLGREADKGIDKLFKRVAKAQEKGPGKKAKGMRNTPGMFKLFETLNEVRKGGPDGKGWTADEGRAEADKLQGLIDSGSIGARVSDKVGIEKLQNTLLAINLIPLFSGWSGRMGEQEIDGRMTRVRVSVGASAAQKMQALEAATLAWKGGLAVRAMEVAETMARLDAMRDQGVIDVLTTSGSKTKDEQAIFDRSRTGIARRASYSMMSYDGFLRWFLGDNSKLYKYLTDGERTAANAYHDGMQRINIGVEELFTSLGGSRLKGRELQFSMSQKDIQIMDSLGNERTISQNEAITAMLLFRQDDGRRHMEGIKDEDGNVVGTWSYDQDFMDELATRMKPESLAVFNYLVDAYAREYDSLNEVYRRVNGIDLPQNKFYSPISVLSERLREAGVDPLTGFFQGGMSGVNGSFRSRGASTMEPDYKDAVKTFVAHSMQMEYYKAYAEYSKEARAILGGKAFTDALQRAGGKEATLMLANWLETNDQGGVRDAGQQIAISEWLKGVGGNLSKVMLYGKFGTIILNLSQIGGAAVDMPAAQYMRQLSKSMTGKLNWFEALDTPYIRRRIEQMPPVIRQALEANDAKMPNRLDEISEKLGYGITASDGFFTAGTYVMVLDYQRSLGAEMGLTGAELDAWARNETERIVDRVAQPTRQGTRSYFEIQGSPERKAMWNFVSEPRKNLGLMIHGFSNRSNKQLATGTAIYTILFGAVLSSLIRSAWRDNRDEEDDKLFDAKHWDLSNLAWSIGTDWMNGIPFAGKMIQDSLLSLVGQRVFSGSTLDTAMQGARAVRKMVIMDIDDIDFEEGITLLRAMVAGAGTFSADAASATGILNAIVDSVKVFKNYTK